METNDINSQALGRHHMQGKSMTSMPSYSNQYVTQGPKGSAQPILTTEQRIAWRDQNLSRQSTQTKGAMVSSKSTKHIKHRNSSATFHKAGNEADDKSSELLFTMQASGDRPRQSVKLVHGESGKRDFTKHTDYFAARDSILGFEHQKGENLLEEDGDNMTQTPVDESFSAAQLRISKRQDSETMNNDYITYISRANKADDTNFQEMIKKRQLDVQKRLASIQQQVEQQTQELEKQRMNNRFSGLPMDTFKPFKRTKDGRIVEEGPGGVNNILELQSPADPRRYTSTSAQNQSLHIEAQPSDMKSRSILESGPNAHVRGNDFDNTIQESLFLQDDTSNDMDNKKPVNNTDFISGGLHNYRQSQQFTVKSVIRKMSIEQPRTTKNQESSPQLAKSAESHRGLKKQTSQVILNNLFDKDFMSQTIPQTQRYSAKDINKQFDKTLKLDDEVRNELLTGGLDVILHPQDRKRLGLEPERPGEYTVRGSRSPRAQQQPPKKPNLTQQQKQKAVKKLPNIDPVESPMKTKNSLPELTSEANERQRIRNEKGSKNINMAAMKSLKNVQSVKSMAAGGGERAAEDEMPSPQPAQDAAQVQMQVYPDDYRYVMDTTQPLLHDISHISQVDSCFTEPRPKPANQLEIVSDQEDTEIIDAKLDQMKSQGEMLVKQRREILQILIDEETMLYKYATQTQEDLQAYENAASKGQDSNGEDIIDYKTILQNANVDKIRVMFFVRQLQITFILTRALIRVFVPGLLQKFQVKFQHMCQNIHQNFLLMIDMILKEFLLQSQTGVPYGQLSRQELFAQQQQSERGPNITKSNEYRLLRNLTDTRLRNKEKQSKTLTSFRQNNEVNIQNLKKIVKYVIDSYTQDCIAFKVLAFDIQEIMRHHLSNAIANMNSNHFEALTEHPDSSISSINKNITSRTNLLASVSGSTATAASPKQQESKSKVQSIAQNNAGQTTLKRGKSTAKLHNSAGPTAKAPPASASANAAQVSNQQHNSSVLSLHVYSSSTGGERQPHPSTSLQSSPNPPQRINDLINAANQGLSQGVLAGRKSPSKKTAKIQQAKPPAPADENIQNQTKHNFQNQAIQNAKGGIHDLNRSQPQINRPNSPNYMNRTKAAISKTKKQVMEAAQRSTQVVSQKNRQLQSNSALGMAQAARRVQGHQEYKRGSAGSGQAVSPVKQHVGASSFVSPVKQSTIQRKYGYSQQQSPGGVKSQSRPMSRQQEQKQNQSLNQAQTTSKRGSPSKAIALNAGSQRPLQKRMTLQASQQKILVEEQKNQNRQSERQPTNKGGNNVFQHSQFMHMPETLAFIMKCQQQEQQQQESDRAYQQWNESGSLRSEPMNDSIAQMLAKIQNQHVTNVDKSINFYGPVINHVYPSAMPDTLDSPEVGGYSQIGNLQQLHELSNPDFKAPPAFDARHAQGDRQRGSMTSIKKVNRPRDEQLIKEHEKIRFMSNSQLNCYEEEEDDNDYVQESHTQRRTTAGNKSQANTVARHAQKQDRVTVKQSMIDLNSDSGSQLGLARVNKRLTQSVLAAQSDIEISSPSKVGTRAGSGIGTGTKNLAIRQRKLAQMHQQRIQDYNDQDLSQFKVPQEIFATPPVGNLMKTHELKLNFPPQMQPQQVRNSIQSQPIIETKPSNLDQKPRNSAMTRNDDHNTFGTSFKTSANRPCLTISAHDDEYQFEDPVPQRLVKVQQAQDTTSRRELRQKELSEFEQIEAEIFSGSKIGDADANFSRSKIEQDSIQDVSYIPAVNDSCFAQDFDVRKTEFIPFQQKIVKNQNDIRVNDNQNNYEISLIRDEEEQQNNHDDTEEESLGMRPPVETSVNDDFAFDDENESDNTETFDQQQQNQQSSHRSIYSKKQDDSENNDDDEQSQLEQLEIQNEQFYKFQAKILENKNESQKVTPNRKTQQQQQFKQNSGRMTMDDFDHHCVTTDQKQNRYSMRSNTYEENALTLPRKQKVNKRIFGEYDATAEEEMSLINSQIGHLDQRASNFLGSNASSHQQSPSHQFDSPGTQNNNFSPGVRLNINEPLNSGRHSLIQLIPVRQGSYESIDNIRDTPNGKLNLGINLESLNLNQPPEEYVVQPMLSQREIEQTRRTIQSKQLTMSTPRQQKRSSYDDQEYKTHDQSNLQVIETQDQIILQSQDEDNSIEFPEAECEPFQKMVQEKENLISYAYESNITVSEKPVENSITYNQDTDQETDEIPPEETIDEDSDDEQAQIDREFRQLRELVTIPYLPPLSEGLKLPKKTQNPYTLVLDLDETLIHFEVDEDVNPEEEEPGYYLIRPGAVRFLNELSEYYEIVVFTAAMPDYADWILDNIDRAGRISHRLYRQHTTPHEDYAIKDLRNLGRDLSKTIIIDNLAENFNYTTPTNGIWVESWYDDMDCKVLGLLIPFLKDIVISGLDVRCLLTEHIKETFLYRMLDESKRLPSCQILIAEEEEFQNQIAAQGHE